MGLDGDSMAVLDPQARVRGVKGLRVADCSSMPVIPNGMYINGQEGILTTWQRGSISQTQRLTLRLFRNTISLKLEIHCEIYADLFAHLSIGHTQFPAYGVGERVSDFIKESAQGK